jgi:hypothetical protein
MASRPYFGSVGWNAVSVSLMDGLVVQAGLMVRQTFFAIHLGNKEQYG